MVLNALLLAAALAPSPVPSAPGTLGPAIGQSLPTFRLLDQDGRPQDFESLRGPKGLLLLFFRSVVW